MLRRKFSNNCAAVNGRHRTMTQSHKSAAEHFLDRAVETTAVIGFTGLVIIAFMTLLDVSLRYLGFPRVPGLHDVEEIGFAIVIASCFPAGLKKGNAVTVRILGKILGPRAHGWLDVVGAVFMLIFFGLVAWQFIVFAIDYAASERTTSTLEWPVAPVWSLVSLLMIACVGVQAWVVGASLQAAQKEQPMEHRAESP
jgi:TRAP-type C4-dicarboxylate transport system permease small subunit